MGKGLKKLAGIGLICAAAACSPLTAFAGEWQCHSGSYRYMEVDRFATGWRHIAELSNPEASHWYYFDEDGDMVTGWREIKEANSNLMHWYYFDVPNGAMWEDQVTPDGFYVNKDGVWLEETGPGVKPAEETVTETQAEETAETVSQGDYLSGMTLENEVLTLLNARRAERGLLGLKLNEELCLGADVRAGELTQLFESKRPNGMRSQTVLNNDSYPWVMEVIAKGSTMEECVNILFENGSASQMMLTDGLKAAGGAYVCTEAGIGITSADDGTVYISIFLTGPAV